MQMNVFFLTALIIMVHIPQLHVSSSVQFRISARHEQRVKAEGVNMSCGCQI